MSTIPMSKIRLLTAIQTGYLLFRESLAELDPGRMNTPGVVGKWSLKDTVAHIVVHEQRMIQWIAQRLRGDHPATFQPYAMPDEQLDQLNEQIYQENLDRTLDELLQDLDQTHAAVLSLVETCKEEDLLDPDRFQLLGGEPLWEAIAANTFQHYAEHSRDLTGF